MRVHSGRAGRAGRAPLLLLLLLAVVLKADAVEKVEAPCADRPPQARYSSKTAYQLVHDGNVKPQDQVRGCHAVYLWHLLRHGTRFPSAKEIVQLSVRVPALQERLRKSTARSPLCRADLDRMLAWTLNATRDEGNQLAAQGEQDLLGIASRFKSRLPNFFREHAHPDDFVFRSTDTQRTKASARWYGRGLFSEPINLPKPLPQDPLLKFYDMCPAWEEAVDKNATAKTEVTAFQKGEVVRAALERVSRRLGFQDTLSYEEVDLLWEACRYDQAWHPDRTAAWCNAFGEEDLLVFEYRADLKYFYVGGYGNAMDLQLGCPLVKDLVEQMSAVEKHQRRGGSMYFTHSTAVHLTLARLGMGRDSEPLTAANYERMKRVRHWDISRMAPFAANLAFVLYECPVGERHKIRLFLNEKPTPVEGCSDPDALCSWTDFRHRFAGVAESCSLAFCNRTSGSASAAKAASTASVLIPAAIIALAAR